MKKITSFTIFISFLALAFTGGSALAKPSEKVNHPTFQLPSNATKISEDVFYLGKTDQHGKTVEGYAYIHRADNKKGDAKPESTCGNNVCEPGENKNNCSLDCSGNDGGGDTGSTTSSCYDYLASNTKWKSAENWLVNTSNNSGLSSVFDTLKNAINTWEDAADGSIDGTKGYDILGEGSTTTDLLAADTSSPDDLNEVYFADIESSNAIGVTIVWGIFRGHPSWRELIEWDQIYDDADYDWSDDCSSNDCTTKMDFPNIAIHELGHSVGLDDLYDDACSEATMYGYGEEGEIKKRDLIDGDINGVTDLYN